MSTYQAVESDFLIIGGGILGAATASYLAQFASAGTRITVLEAGQPATGTTCQAAGLLTRLKTDTAMAEMVGETYTAIERLSQHSDQPLPFRQVGSIHVAKDDQQYLENTAAQARQLNVEFQWLSPSAVTLQAPWFNQTAAERALFIPDDGYIDPALLAQAYLSEARQLGVKLCQNTRVDNLIIEQGRVAGVRCGEQVYRAGTTISCAGPWSVALLAEAGIMLPMAPVRSHYWITDDSDLFPMHSPAMILADANAYTRPEVGGLLFGLRDQQPVYGDPANLPADLQGYLFNCDPDGFECLESGYERLLEFCPVLETLGLRHYITGISSYTPDGRPILGATDLPGLLLATGCSGSGITLSGGIGRLLAEQALERETFVDDSAFRCNRFGEIDPFSDGFRARCALARSAKRSG